MPDGDWRNQLRSGQKLRGMPGGFYNAALDVIKRDQMRREFGKAGKLADTSPDGLIYVQNSSGADVARFGILGISGVLIDADTNLPEFQDNAVLTGVTPSKPDHVGKFVIAYKAMPKDAIAPAFVFGTAPVQVNIVTEGDKFADITDSDGTQLTSAASGGAQILYAPSGTGKKWCLVRFGGSSDKGLFVVNLVQDGGDDGNDTGTSYATWTYTAYYRKADGSDGDEIHSDLEVLRLRRIMCSMIKATMGEGYFDSAGTFILADAWEQENQENCVTSGGGGGDD